MTLTIKIVSSELLFNEIGYFAHLLSLLQT